MFTGIVEEVGVVSNIKGSLLCLKAKTVLGGMRLGDSISLDGVCLTVVSLDDGGFCIELSPETLRRTTFGALKAGDPVNLERPWPSATAWAATSSRATWTALDA